MSTADLWTCPDCGHRFVTRNVWHSCGRWDLERHFRGRPRAVRDLFDALRARVEALGPVTVYPQKTRIVCQVRVRFAAVTVQKGGLRVALWLDRRAEHPTLRRHERYGPSSWGHHLKLTAPEEMDAAFDVLLREAYRVGVRGHPRRG